MRLTNSSTPQRESSRQGARAIWTDCAQEYDTSGPMESTPSHPRDEWLSRLPAIDPTDRLIDERPVTGPTLADRDHRPVVGPFSQRSPVDVDAEAAFVKEQLTMTERDVPMSPMMRRLVIGNVATTVDTIRHDNLRQLPKAERLPRTRRLAYLAMKANLRVIDGGRDDNSPEAA